MWIVETFMKDSWSQVFCHGWCVLSCLVCWCGVFRRVGCPWCVGLQVWCLFGVLVQVFVVLDPFWCVGACLQVFRRVCVFRCVDVVSSIFLHVWCFLVWCLSVFVVFGAVVWCLEVFVVGCLSLLCWWCLQVFVVLDAFGVVSSSFRRVWCLCCVGAVSLSFSSCLVPFWCVCVCVLVCLQVFVVLDAFWCWCGVFKFFVVFGAFWCVGVVSSKYSCWMPFGVLCGAFKFSSCWVPFSVLVWCLQVFVVSWSFGA